METLVLLGAGASYGSEPEGGVNTPPLGKDLFFELCKLGGIASKLPAHMKSVFRQDFEQGMAFFNERRNIDLQLFHRELSSYLADFVPSAKSYYAELVKLFHGRNVVFSSLNYDMMLEEAILAAGLHIRYRLMSEPDCVRLLKPHGSINFWPDFPHEMFVNCTSTGSGSALSAPVRPIHRQDAKHRCGVDTSFSPAISMYAKGKKVSVCPDYVSEQQMMFAEACGRASKIMIVGVRVVPEDSHIWKPIADSCAEVVYFGSNEDEVELKSWGVESGRKNIVFVEGFFGKAISEFNKYF